MPGQGRAVLVIGGSRRTGREIALEFARQGYAVAVNARQHGPEMDATLRMLMELDANAVAVAGDITDPEASKAMIDSAAAQLGRLDVVVNCAVRREHGALADLPMADWHASLASVLDGALLTTRYATPHLAKTGGTILLFSGASAYLGAVGPATPTAKSALEGFLRAASMEIGPRGVSINAISPGRIDDNVDNAAKREMMERERPVSKIPLRRAGTVHDVAGAVTALCSGAFAYMTGQVIHLNGGLYMG